MDNYTGEWFYEGAEKGGRVIANDERQTIIHVPPCSPFNEQAIADAKLIAAARELLSALRYSQAAIREIREQGAPCESWDVIEAMNLYAIAKAKG